MTATTRGRLGLWRLEWLRVWRTRVWLLVTGAYVAFGVSGPVIAAYLPHLLEQLEGQLGATAGSVELGEPTVAAGIEQFAGNASQLGVLTVIIAAVAAVGYRNNTPMAQWLRTQVPAAQILVPRFVVTAAVAAAALIAGTAAAVVSSTVMIGVPPLWPLAWGTGLGVLYLCFVAAVAGHATTVTRNRISAVFVTIANLVAFPAVAALVPAVKPWLPSELVGAVTAAVSGANPGEYKEALAVTVAVTAALIADAVRRDTRRET